MEKGSKQLLPWHRVLIILLILLLLAGAVFGIFLLTRLRMPDNAVICGLDVSAMLVGDVEQLLEERISSYSLNLTVGEQTIHATAEDLGMVFLKNAFEDVVKSASENGIDVDPWAVISIDQSKLESYINANFDQRHTASVPAKVVWDDGTSNFKVIPGEPETWYNAELLADLVRDAVANLTVELEIPENLLYLERVDADQQVNADALAANANELMNLELEYVFNPRKVELGREILDGSIIASFLRIDMENNLIYADEDAVSVYVEEFASDYTYFKHKDRFVTHGGDRIDISITFQEQTVDTQALTNMIVESIANGTSGSYEAPYSGAVNFEGNYIEVSIPEQHLWVYQNGVVVLESDVVTGNESIGKKTPTGINYVRGHLQSLELFGDYYVNYWMAITRGGIYGFHDADGWRQPEEYGGDTYKTHGSGGCVNVPLENMEKMYYLVPDATPIVIYNEYFYD